MVLKETLFSYGQINAEMYLTFMVIIIHRVMFESNRSLIIKTLEVNLIEKVILGS